MKVVKKTKDYTIYQKRSGRYGVQDSEKNWINQKEKVVILTSEGLIKNASASKATPKKSEMEENQEDNSAAAEVVEEEVAAESSAEVVEEEVASETSAEAVEEPVLQETKNKPRAKRSKKAGDEAIE